MPCTAAAGGDALQMHQGMVRVQGTTSSQGIRPTHQQATGPNTPHHARTGQQQHTRCWPPHPPVTMCASDHRALTPPENLSCTAAGLNAAALCRTVLYKNAGQQAARGLQATLLPHRPVEGHGCCCSRAPGLPALVQLHLQHEPAYTRGGINCVCVAVLLTRSKGDMVARLHCTKQN
jgi:hypothetical protein